MTTGANQRDSAVRTAGARAAAVHAVNRGADSRVVALAIGGYIGTLVLGFVGTCFAIGVIGAF